MNRQIKSNTVNDFINYYYGNLNNRNLDQLSNLFNDYSQMIFQDKSFNGNNEILNLLKNNIDQNIRYEIKSFNYLNNGQRKANILIHGNIISKNNIFNFTDFIQLTNSKKHDFWVPVIITKII